MTGVQWLYVRNWEHWQSYRSDRGPPPWIKVHRRLMQDMEWSMLTDAEKGQLVSLWILAADRNGWIPGEPRVLQRLACLEAEPDLSRFKDLGFLSTSGSQDDANATSQRRQPVAPEERRGEESTPLNPPTADVTATSQRRQAEQSTAGGSVPPHPPPGNDQQTDESARASGTSPRQRGTNPRGGNGIDRDYLADRWARLVWHCRQGHRLPDLENEDPALAHAARQLGGMAKLRRMSEAEIDRHKSSFAAHYRESRKSDSH